MGLTGKNTSLDRAKADQESLGNERIPVQTTYYDLKLAKDLGSPSVSKYWNPKATGGPIIRVISPFNAEQVLFLRVVNFVDGDTEPMAGTHTVTSTLDAKDFTQRPLLEKMPRNLPSRGLDGIAWVIRTKPLDEIADQTLSSNPGDVFNGRTTDQPTSKVLKTDGGGSIKVHKDGIDLLDAGGEGLTFGTGGIRLDKPLDTTQLKETGMLHDSPVKNWIGLPETIITIPSWEKWPDIAKIVSWANVIAFAIQAIDKIHRANKAMKKM